ncbi:MAG: DnaJ domain-containing protein [Marinobacterium sp.]|nr:DnaJ domain-containing protein [Marinobacterium sp.]
MRNPLTIPLITLLRQQPEGCREYDLMRNIEADGGFPDLSDDYQLALFQKHFLLKNALYQLQETLWQEEQLYLSITPLLIRLEPCLTCDSGVNLPDQNNDIALRSYYLDWQEYYNATVESVDALLDSFWRRYAGIEQRHSALKTLELDEDATATEIRLQYRRLASRHHPDKGGCSERFIALRQAYETLNVH